MDFEFCLRGIGLVLCFSRKFDISLISLWNYSLISDEKHHGSSRRLSESGFDHIII